MHLLAQGTARRQQDIIYCSSKLQPLKFQNIPFNSPFMKHFTCDHLVATGLNKPGAISQFIALLVPAEGLEPTTP